MSERVCRNLLGFFHLWFVFLVLGLFFSQNVQTKNPFSCSRWLCCFLTSSRFPSCFSHSFCGVDMTALYICHGGVWPSPVTLLFRLGPSGVLYIPPSFGSTREPGQCKAWKGHHQHTTTSLRKDEKTILGMCQLEFVFVMMLYYGIIHNRLWVHALLDNSWDNFLSGYFASPITNEQKQAGVSSPHVWSKSVPWWMLYLQMIGTQLST